MTKRTKSNKKLRISTETVRRMSDCELKRVAGGPADSPDKGRDAIISNSCWGCGSQAY